jgi:hypothetical protein
LYPTLSAIAGPEYRYLAIREPLSCQLALPGMETQLTLPFQTLNMDRLEYKIFGVVTNMDWDGEELIHWQRKRCGKSEEAHSIMKEDLARIIHKLKVYLKISKLIKSLLVMTTIS